MPRSLTQISVASLALFKRIMANMPQILCYAQMFYLIHISGDCWDLKWDFWVLRTILERDLQSTAQCVYSIPCERGSNYFRQADCGHIDLEAQAQPDGGPHAKIKTCPACEWQRP
jgi:hypothetical protein